MVHIRIKDDESFEALLRRFSKKVQQESIVSEARRRQNFESPTSLKKKKLSFNFKKSIKSHKTSLILHYYIFDLKIKFTSK